MYIKKVVISNIKCFGEGDLGVDLDLQRPDGTYAGWTVLAGLNGSGKSTLLRAIALAVAGEKAAYNLQISFKGWPRFDTDVAQFSVNLVKDTEDKFPNREEDSTNNLMVGLKFITSPPNGTQKYDPIIYEIKDDANPDLTKNIAHNGPWNRNPVGWFIAGYGPFRRLPHADPDGLSTSDVPRRKTQLASLFDGDVSLTVPIPWLKSIHLKALENKAGADELKNGVIAFLNDKLLPPGMTVEKIDSDGLWMTFNGHLLLITDLSDGYRTVAALVLDIIRQLFDTYGEFKVKKHKKNGTYYADYPGVVLIDEMDTHMHPSWQQEIGFWLKSHFPRIQFIVTTHSPFICQAADPKGLIRLPAPGENRPVEHISERLFQIVKNGSVDEAVITELFGLDAPHSKASEKLRNEAAQLGAMMIRGKATPEQIIEYEKLMKELPNTQSEQVDRALRKLGHV